MRYLRSLTLLALIATLACFGYYKYNIESKIDSVAPVITVEEEEITVSVWAGDEELLEGLTASDDRDGDVTDSLVVESMGKFTEKGKMQVSYAAFDQGGNVGTASRVVRYSDYVSPHFAVSEPIRIKQDAPYSNLVSAVTAQDCIDGNLTGFIKYKTGEGAAYNQVGDILLSFQVTNSKGDTSKVEVYGEILDEKEFSKPYPVLSDYLVYTKVGKRLSPSNYLEGVMRNGSLYEFEDEDNERYDRSMVRISDNTDYDTPGVYRVVYTLSSDEKNEGETSVQGHVYLFIVVEE